MSIGELNRPCPCGSGTAYDACCGPLLRGEYQAPTALALMRSRFTAYAVGDGDYLFRTWHPRTRPGSVVPPPDVQWTALSVIDVVGGDRDDDTGIVEFTATFRVDSGPDVVHERSTFARRAGRWMYVDGSTP